jgi:DNA-binding NarL/FixJ family response regulator
MRVLLVDDHPVFRSGMEVLLRQIEPGVEVIHAGTCSEGIRIARRRALNLVFLDLNLPDGQGLACLKSMKEARPSLPVVLISGERVRGELIDEALTLRAMGFVPKSQNAETIVAALRAALSGGVFLPADLLARSAPTLPGMAQSAAARAHHDPSPRPAAEPLIPGITRRQNDVLRYLVQGMPNKRIASKLAISLPVVKKHVSDLLAHFQVVSRTQLVARIALQGTQFGPPELSHPSDDLTHDPSESCDWLR